jgi:SAM-dependent methyltransferase
LGRVVRPVRAIARRRRRARWGNFRRPYPFSERWGFDRGTPVDRFYLDRFFRAHAGDIRGCVLEVKEPEFSDRFGAAITQLDIVDIDPRNHGATLVADLAEAGSLPASTYDCVVLPQTLHYVDDPFIAVANVWQSLRPGGVLLISAPALARTDPELGAIDRWRFLPAGLLLLLQRACIDGEIEVEGHGNLVTSIAFLSGLAAEELRPAELERDDERWPLVVCGRARRPGASR